MMFSTTFFSNWGQQGNTDSERASNFIYTFHSCHDAKGQDVDLSIYKGNALLIVNGASHSFAMNQRLLVLELHGAVQKSNTAGDYIVQCSAPPTAALAPPGGKKMKPWMDIE